MQNLVRLKYYTDIFFGYDFVLDKGRKFFFSEQEYGLDHVRIGQAGGDAR